MIKPTYYSWLSQLAYSTEENKIFYLDLLIGLAAKDTSYADSPNDIIKLIILSKMYHITKITLLSGFV